MPSLVNVEPHGARSLEVQEDDKVVRVHLWFNSEQGLDRVEVDEQPDEVTVTAWVGWRQDARHLRDRSIVAAGTTVTFVDVELSQNLAGRPVRDGARRNAN